MVPCLISHGSLPDEEHKHVVGLYSRQPANGTPYIGVTRDLRTRLEQHRSGHGSEFIKKYRVNLLVHVEELASPQEAIARQKQFKNWRRGRKIELIEKGNPGWSDLSHLL